NSISAEDQLFPVELMCCQKIGPSLTDIETIMGTFELIQLNIICSLWWHIFRIAVFFKLISLPALRRGEINLTIKIFTLNPNKNFKAGLFPQEILTGMCSYHVWPQDVMIGIADPEAHI